MGLSHSLMFDNHEYRLGTIQVWRYLTLNTTHVKSTVSQMILPYLTQNGFELVDVEYIQEDNHWFLRVFVDKEDGIDIDDCSSISEYVSAKLDEQDPIPTAYFLEVCSPGAERLLRTPADFTKSIGQYVCVTTTDDLLDGRGEIEGKLLAYSEDQITIEHQNKPIVVRCSTITNARRSLVF